MVPLVYLDPPWFPQFPECGYTKWTKQDQGGPGVDQGHWQDHGAGWWTRGIQDHLGSLKNIFLMKTWLKHQTKNNYTNKDHPNQTLKRTLILQNPLDECPQPLQVN